MKRLLFIAALWLCMVPMIHAQGLRYSVCIVEPEFSETDKALMSDYSLYMARAGMQSASRALGAYKNEGTCMSSDMPNKQQSHSNCTTKPFGIRIVP